MNACSDSICRYLDSLHGPSQEREERAPRRRSGTRLILAFLLFFLAGFLSATSQAGTIKLRYEGLRFDYTNNDFIVADERYSYDSTMRVVGTLELLTLPRPIGSLSDITDQITHYAFTDGVNLMDSDNSVIQAVLAIGTDNRIIDWVIDISQFLPSDDPPIGDERRNISVSFMRDFFGFFDTGAYTVCVGEDPFIDGLCDMDVQNRGAATLEPGEMAVSVPTLVPVPATALLLFSALPIFGYRR